MTVSMRVMNAGDGYQYLLRSVAAGDGDRARSIPLTRYYAETGTPPGYWLGSGVHAFGSGDLKPGDTVTETQLAALLGAGLDPATGEALGRAYPAYTSIRDRVAARVAALPADLAADARETRVEQIEAEERAKGSKQAVAGFDFTFSVPKSMSVLWALADADTQAMIVEIHHAAVGQVVALLEREVAATRTGVTADDGAVAQVDVTGIAATAYDHWDSRCGDPQLHTHVVVSNKVKTVLDGRWRSLDSRALHAAVVALSEHYNAVLADRMTGTFGVGWEVRQRGEDRNPAWEISGVGDALVGEFSSRSRAIEIEKEQLIATYVERHGRQPSRATVIRMRAQATLATRPEKRVRSLADLSAEWRGRAERILGADATQWARNLTLASPAQVLRSVDIPPDLIAEVGGRVMEVVSQKRATWRHWNLWAEAARQTMGWRFDTVEDREAITALIVDAAEGRCVALTPGELATSPTEFRRTDGTSVFRPRHSVLYSSQAILAAEKRLLNRAEDRTAPTVDAGFVRRIGARGPGAPLTEQQVAALVSIATSGRCVDLLIGPAGAGKTTTMSALRHAWTLANGPGSVVGMAPSSAAAHVLAGDLGIACENTDKWLYEHDRGRADLRAGQLVILDEASLASTQVLDRVTAIAASARAKVLLVGDWAQLQSVDAGGGFALLADARDDTPELRGVHRFVHEWEKTASLELRDGRPQAIRAYAVHQRLREGTSDDMIDAAYRAWRADLRAGLASILVTDATHSVDALNARARAERLLDGETSASREVALAGGARASAGDLIITRENDRRLRTLRGGWVRNGDRWKVTDVRRDGTLLARRAHTRWGSVVALPPDYVREHVDLGYAVTAHRAQGVTTDTAHVLVSASTTREDLYVSMTRGRSSNIAYVALDKPDDSHAVPPPDDVNGHTVLYGVLRHTGAELSAHQTIAAEQGRWGSIAQLAAEYETIAAAAQRDRWAALVSSCGLAAEDEAAVLASTAFGPLTAALRRAEALGHDVDRLLPDLVARRTLGDADDAAAVLVHRVNAAVGCSARGRRRTPHLIAGLIPEARGPVSEEMRLALDERAAVIEARARALAERAVASGEGWTRRAGAAPTEHRQRERWLAEVATVAAYRDRHCVDSTLPLGSKPASAAQKLDASLANAALRRAAKLAAEAASDSRGAAPERAAREGVGL